MFKIWRTIVEAMKEDHDVSVRRAVLRALRFSAFCIEIAKAFSSYLFGLFQAKSGVREKLS